ncbi:MAG: NADH-quinone oxidoreductase subunit K [Candidatus Margulisiibacteriota bacterium]
MLIFYLCGGLFCSGILCMLIQKNLVKVIIGLVLAEYAVSLLMVLVGFNGSRVNPLITELAMVTLTIGLASLILLTAISVRVNHTNQTLDISKINQLKEYSD